MATFTKKNWITGEIITDTKLNNEKGYYLLETDSNDEEGFELQVGNLTEDDLLNIIRYQSSDNLFYKMISWNYNMLENKYSPNSSGLIIEYYPSTGILGTPR